MLLLPTALPLSPCGLVHQLCCPAPGGDATCHSDGRPIQCTDGICEYCANVGEPVCRSDVGDFCAPELEADSDGVCICPRDFGDEPCVSGTCRPGLTVGPDGRCAGIGGCGEEGAACCDTAPGFECRNLIGETIDGRNSSTPLQCNDANVCQACGKVGLPVCVDAAGEPVCVGRFVIVDGMCELCGALGELACDAPYDACDEGLVEELGRCVDPDARPCGGRLQDCCAGGVCEGALRCFTRFRTRPQGLCVTKFRSRGL